jgi:hypothetical protein
MRKGRIVFAGIVVFGLMVAATGAWAVTKARAPVQTDALLDRVSAVCETPDSAGCAALLNQIEPGA